MIATDKSYLKHKMDEPQSSNAPEIIVVVSISLLSAPPPSLPTATTPATQHQLLAIQQKSDVNQQEQSLGMPRAATPPAARHQPLNVDTASWLPASPAAAQQSKEPPKQQPAT